ncbi:hypothetical protein V0U79_06105 [Hyphobacterium sp. HN65]|uniref:Uncharacterized protein n=1 Tax=Hyphobacterium lacteum TaxID=3116575 RepID=A0ABU7LPV1_9PROT|nr:hypothetical protein [Hyphobacterium sp. HN65]MEE2525932.1 hypothetical protein [Hyphobacterium sp. HN65]
MILARISKAVREQNWFAVALEFIIVIAGVVIGFQVTAWNADRTQEARVNQVLVRLESEVRSNLTLAQRQSAMIEEATPYLETVFDAIHQCELPEEGISYVHDVIWSLSGDWIPTYLDTVLQATASDVDLTSRLSPDFQAAMDTYAGHIAEDSEQLQINFDLMWGDIITRHPAFGLIDDPETGEATFGLTIPFTEVCRDAGFQRRYSNTVTFIMGFQRRADNLIEDIGLMLAAMDEEKRQRGIEADEVAP